MNLAKDLLYLYMNLYATMKLLFVLSSVVQFKKISMLDLKFVNFYWKTKRQERDLSSEAKC